MSEEEFLNSFDCRFPYEAESQWRTLIRQGKEISTNASFGVLEEISRKPYGHPVSKKEQLAMVNAWEVENDHELAQPIIEAAKANITGKLLSVDKVLSLFEQIKTYKHLYCALNIAYFSCNDVDGIVENKRQKIVKSWERHD